MNKLELNAKNMAVQYGLYSKEYAEAIKLMQDDFLTRKLSKKEKVINHLNKLLWLKIQNSY